MRLLLDTHVAIWAISNSKALPLQAIELIAARENSIYVSAVTIWEISIKHALAKPSAPPFSGPDAVQFFERAGYLLLDISAAHAATAGTLPLLHRDPFDRMLVAQARHEPMRLLTHDQHLAAYGECVTLI